MMEYKLLPVEPTEEMIAAANAGDREYSLRNFGMPGVLQGPYDHWIAMVAAAPVIEQEPVAYVSSDDLYNLPYDRTATIQTNRSERMTPLYAAPVAQQVNFSPEPRTADEARYRWLRERHEGWSVTGTLSHDFGDAEPGKVMAGICTFTNILEGSALDSTIDAAILAAPVPQPSPMNDKPACHSQTAENERQTAPLTDERKAAEQEYTITAFDYVRDPVGSRNWELFWKGWQARSILAAAPEPQQELLDAAQAVIERWDTPQWKDAEPTAHVIARLRRAILAAKGDV